MAHTLLGNVNGNGRNGPFRLWESVFTLSLLIFGNSLIALAQPESIYRLPAGTRIHLTLDAEISSRVASVDDTFLAFVTKPLSVKETVVLPAGAVIEGRVRGVDRPGVGGRNGKLDLLFETLTMLGRSRQIEGVIVNLPRSRGTRHSSLLKVIGGAVVGAGIGGAVRSGGGVAIGAAAGAAAGTGIALLRKGRDATIKRGEEFEIELRVAVVLPVEDF